MSLQFFIKPTTGKTFVVRTDESFTVSELKKLISEREGYPSGSFSLRHSGKILKNEKTMKESNINDDHTVYVW